MPPRTREPTTAHLLPPILALLAPPSPSAYSAHQKALTTIARVQGAAPRVALDIALGVARELLKLGEGGSGVELAVKGLGIAEGLGEGLGDEMRATLTQLLALTPPAPSAPWRKKLADASIRYSIHANEVTTGDKGPGDAALHHYIGQLYARDGALALAEPHLVAAGAGGKRDAAALLAEVMYEWSGKGENGDVGAFAIRGVLPFLLHTPPAILPAQIFLSHYLSLLASPSSHFRSSFLSTAPAPPSSSHSLTSGASAGAPAPDAPSEEIQITTSPSLNFLQLALLAAQRAPAPGESGVQARGMDGGPGRDWETLVGRYTRLGGRGGVLADKEVQDALAHIGVNLFLIPPPRGAQPDMLQSLMGSLFGGGGGGR